MADLSNKVKDIDTLLEWEYDVINSNYLSTIIFFSKKSEPSTRMISQLELITNYFNEAKFFSLDIDKHPTITWKFRVTILPTIMIFRQGQKLQEMITLKSNEEVITVLEQYVKRNNL